MKIDKGITYQLFELEHGFVITYANVPPGPKAQTLVEADAHDLAAYLVRYLQARETGLNMQEAHKAALADAVVMRPGAMEQRDKKLS